MNPGELREVLQVLKPSRAQDETGQYVDGWELAGTMRGSLRTSDGRETVAAGEQTVARVPVVFRVRYPHTFEVNPTMRIVHRARLFQIVGAVDENGRRAALLVTCEELVGEEPPWPHST